MFANTHVRKYMQSYLISCLEKGSVRRATHYSLILPLLSLCFFVLLLLISRALTSEGKLIEVVYGYTNRKKKRTNDRHSIKVFLSLLEFTPGRTKHVAYKHSFFFFYC